MNSTTAYGRTLVGDSLGFHILFALLGVGIPLLMLLAEFIALRRHDEKWLKTAHDWSRILVVLFVAGTVSGTIISLQFSSVWPTFTTIASDVVGLSFFMEGFAFLIEALFLGLYMLTWSRWKGTWKHLIIGIPVALASVTSAFFITTVNAWMNNPQGFEYSKGKVSHVHVLQAVFNPATPTETSHSIFAYYLTTVAFFATWYAWQILRKKGLDEHGKQILTYLVWLLLIFSIFVGATGDASGKYLAKYEPLKLAAAEGLYATQAHAPLQIGGIISGGAMHGALKVPGLLSWLAYGSTNSVVRGLNSFNPALWPPIFIHYCFDAMAIIGTLLVLIPILYLTFKKYRLSRPMLWGIVLTGPLAITAVEVGWMLTEIGRQPYAIRGVLLTKDAITPSAGVIQAAAAFPCLYVLLLIATIYILKRLPRGKVA